MNIPNQQIKDTKRKSKFQCHFCSKFDGDMVQCNICVLSFCKYCVGILAKNKDILDEVYSPQIEMGNWACFVCRQECHCSNCSSLKSNRNKKNCAICKDICNLSKVDHLIEKINSNVNIKKEILEYELFSPLIKKSSKEEKYLCEKCKSKIMPIINFQQQDKKQKNKNKLIQNPINPPKINLESNFEISNLITTFTETPSPLLSENQKNIQVAPPLIEQRHSVRAQSPKHQPGLNSQQNQNYITQGHSFTNYNYDQQNKDSNFSELVHPYSNTGFINQDELTQQPQPFLLESRISNGTIKNSLQRKLFIILYQSISFYFNNCLQFKVNVLGNLKLLLNQIKAEAIDNRKKIFGNNSQLNQDHDDVIKYLLKTSDDIMEQIMGMQESQEKINKLFNPYLVPNIMLNNGLLLKETSERNGFNTVVVNQQYHYPIQLISPPLAEDNQIITNSKIPIDDISIEHPKQSKKNKSTAVTQTARTHNSRNLRIQQSQCEDNDKLNLSFHQQDIPSSQKNKRIQSGLIPNMTDISNHYNYLQ